MKSEVLETIYNTNNYISVQTLILWNCVTPEFLPQKVIEAFEEVCATSWQEKKLNRN